LTAAEERNTLTGTLTAQALLSSWLALMSASPNEKAAPDS
jgi:hypothetical protein